METTKPVPTRNKRPQMPFRTTSDNFAWLRARADRENTSMNDVMEQLLRADRMRVMEPISTKERLPKNNQYVLARFPNMPWDDEDSDGGHFWVVVKFIKGISIEEREALNYDDERKRIYAPEDEYANNKCPYFWDAFGADSFFGQDADYWCNLPKMN